MDKTIKQIAEELGVSKQAVRNEIEKQKMQSSLQRVGNQFALNKKQENLIKRAFLSRQTQNKNEKQVKSEDIVYDILKQNIEILQQQLMVKDKQIEELTQTLKTQAHSELAGKLQEQALLTNGGEKPTRRYRLKQFIKGE